MDRKTAIWFMPDGIALSKEKKPLMLESVLFCPVLTWACTELTQMGIERIFIISDTAAHDLMKPYVPESAVFVDGARHAEELLRLLADEEGEAVVLNGVVLPVGVFSGGAVYAAKATAIRAVLREHGAFAAFPEGSEILKGFLPVGDAEELRAAQPMCRQKIMQKHLDGGVEILDVNHTYIDPRIGSEGLGRTFIGPACPFGMVKPSPDCTSAPNSGWLPMPERVDGFAQVHVSGTGGGPKYGNILLQPFVGEGRMVNGADILFSFEKSIK